MSTQCVSTSCHRPAGPQPYHIQNAVDPTVDSNISFFYFITLSLRLFRCSSELISRQCEAICGVMAKFVCTQILCDLVGKLNRSPPSPADCQVRLPAEDTLCSHHFAFARRSSIVFLFIATSALPVEHVPPARPVALCRRLFNFLPDRLVMSTLWNIVQRGGRTSRAHCSNPKSDGDVPQPSPGDKSTLS